MEKEFSCIHEHKNTKNELEWADVCRTSEKSSSGVVTRDDLVSFALEEYSHEMKAEFKSYKNADEDTTPSPPPEQSYGTKGRAKYASNYIGDARDIDIEERSKRPFTPKKKASVEYSLEESTPPNFDAKFNINGGYRTDKLIWNIAGTASGCCPNILSELTWKELHSYVVKASSTLTFMGQWVVDGSFDYGDIFEGENQDSDYLGDNRTLEFSRSNNNGGGGNVMDWSVGGGFKFHLSGRKAQDNFAVNEIWVTPLAGYSHHEQNLRITDGFQTIPATGAFASLGSSYETEWDGPWLGFEAAGAIDRFTASFRFEYHWADYYADADWNLRNDFAHPKSYEHVTDAEGRVLVFTGGYKLTNNWSLNLEANIQNWESDPGIDRTFFSDGTTSETKLNEVLWDSYAFMGGFTYRFGL